jgi:hypothetical protein
MGVTVPEHSYVLNPEIVTGAVHRAMFPMEGLIGPILVHIESVLPENEPFTITMAMECKGSNIAVNIEGKVGLNVINVRQPVSPCDRLCITAMGADATLHGIWVAYEHKIKKVAGLPKKEISGALGVKNESEPGTPPVAGSLE